MKLNVESVRLVLERIAVRGEDDGESFFLRIEARLLDSPPQKYELITFRGTTYKIDHSDLDSGGLVWRVYLKSLTSRGT